MKRRQLFARIAALFVAPSVIKAAPPQIIMKTRSLGSSTYSAGLLAGWLQVQQMKDSGIAMTPEQERMFINRVAARVEMAQSLDGRIKYQRKHLLS